MNTETDPRDPQFGGPDTDAPEHEDPRKPEQGETAVDPQQAQDEERTPGRGGFGDPRGE